MTKKITKLDLAPQILTRQRTAAYARVSCGKDEMLHSLAAQVSFYSELIQSRAEWEYAGVYADEAETGTKDSRPEFRRLIDDCRAGKIEIKCAYLIQGCNGCIHGCKCTRIFDTGAFAPVFRSRVKKSPTAHL